MLVYHTIDDPYQVRIYIKDHTHDIRVLVNSRKSPCDRSKNKIYDMKMNALYSIMELDSVIIPQKYFEDVVFINMINNI